MINSNNTLLTLCSLLGASLLTTISGATELFSDDFDAYTDGQLVPQGDWEGNTGTTVAEGGAQPFTGAPHDSVQHALASAHTPGQTIYFSFDAQDASDDAYVNGLTIGPDTTIQWTGGSPAASIGIAGNLFKTKLTGESNTTINPVDGEVYKIVGRLEFDVDGGANERLTMWIDPASESDPAAMVNTTGDLGWTQVEYVALSAINYDGLPIISLADNVIVATTFDLAIGIAPSPFKLTITPNGSDYDLAWESQAGMRYRIRSTADLSDDLETWDIVEQDIIPTPPTTTKTVSPVGSFRFYRVEEYLAPPVVVYSEEFDGADPGWTTGFDPADTAMNTVWELGSPSAVGPAAAHSTPNCYGTNLSANYGTDSNIWLRTTPIDLTAHTAGTLAFKQFKDTELGFDYGTIRILAADDLAELAVLDAVVDGTTTDWSDYSKALPAAAFTEEIILEFQFQSDDLQFQAGWYIDGVEISVPGT